MATGAAEGGALAPGSVASGTLAEGALDSYTFTAQTGQGVALRVTDVAGSAFVPGMVVYGPTGTVIANVSGADVASTSFSAPATRTFTVVVYDNSAGAAQGGPYNVSLMLATS